MKTISTTDNITLPADDVRKLVDAVRGYLNNDTGNDDRFILAMEEYVSNIERRLLGAARKGLRIKE